MLHNESFQHATMIRWRVKVDIITRHALRGISYCEIQQLSMDKEIREYYYHNELECISHQCTLAIRYALNQHIDITNTV